MRNISRLLKVNICLASYSCFCCRLNYDLSIRPGARFVMKISRIKVPEELRRLSTHKIMEGTAIVRTKSLQPAAKKLLSISNI